MSCAEFITTLTRERSEQLTLVTLNIYLSEGDDNPSLVFFKIPLLLSAYRFQTTLIMCDMIRSRQT